MISDVKTFYGIELHSETYLRTFSGRCREFARSSFAEKVIEPSRVQGVALLTIYFSMHFQAHIQAV